MYIKQKDIIIVNKLEDLPIDELKVGKQIITFEDNYLKKEDDNNNTFNNVLVKKENNIYLFNKSANFVSDSYYRECFLGNENYDSLYLEFNKKLHLLSSQSSLDICNQNIDFESEDEDDVIFAQIYDFIYLKKKTKIPFTLKMNNKKYYQFMAFDLNEESAIVFITIYDVDFECKSLRNYQTVAIINKDKTVNSLMDYNYIEIKNLLKDSKMFLDFYFDSFLDKIDEASRYDVDDYLKEKANNTSKGFDNLSYQLMFPNKLESLFLPVFVNEEREFYIYPSSTRNDKIGHCYIKENDNELKLVNINTLRDTELKGDIRIAKSIRVFNFYNKSGLSPYDGIVYTNGVDNSDNTKILYKDYDSIVLTILGGGFGRKRDYYFKIKDYYIQLNASLDLEKIKEIDDRIEVITELNEKSEEV